MKTETIIHNVQLGKGYTVNPAKVMLITPTHDGQVHYKYAGGLLACGNLFGGVGFIPGCSDVALARARQAHSFLQSKCDWLLSIDADIGFTRNDLMLLYEDDAPVRVAEYAKKNFKQQGANQFGLGFALIHRDVFTALDVVEQEAVPGVPIVQQFFWDGEILSDYFIRGAMESRWVGEDHGFFTLVRMAGITPRVETRTRLTHWGPHGFEYTPPDVKPTELPEQQ